MKNVETPREFYEAQYRGERYAAYASPATHPFRRELEALLVRSGNAEGSWLEVGCGRGWLQDAVADYVGVDIAETVAAFLNKPFYCAPAEKLPFADNRFDGIWSYAVLEHVENPEQGLAEMRRVLKPGGILLLAPAWHCRPWAGLDYAWKSYGELSWRDRLRKAAIPLQNALVIRALVAFPCRIVRWVGYLLSRRPTRFLSRRLIPNYSDYKIVDADARHALDPFEAVLWFRSRGDRILSPAGWWRGLFARAGTLVVEVRKP